MSYRKSPKLTGHEVNDIQLDDENFESEFEEEVEEEESVEGEDETDEHRSVENAFVAPREMPASSETRLDQLPPELMENIICHLTASDAARLGGCSKNMRAVVEMYPADFWRGDDITISFEENLLSIKETIKLHCVDEHYTETRFPVVPRPHPRFDDELSRYLSSLCPSTLTMESCGEDIFDDNWSSITTFELTLLQKARPFFSRITEVRLMHGDNICAMFNCNKRTDGRPKSPGHIKFIMDAFSMITLDPECYSNATLTRALAEKNKERVSLKSLSISGAISVYRACDFIKIWPFFPVECAENRECVRFDVKLGDYPSLEENRNSLIEWIRTNNQGVVVEEEPHFHVKFVHTAGFRFEMLSCDRKEGVENLGKALVSVREISYRAANRLHLMEFSEELINNLIKAGFKTVVSVACADYEELRSVEGMTNAKANWLIEQAGKITPSGFITALWPTITTSDVVKIRTGSAQLDQVLHGGVEIGTLIEVSSDGATCATQLCHTLAVTCQLPAHLGGASGKCIWIDTEQSFDVDYLVAVAERYNIARDVALNGVAVAHAANAEEQMQLLNDAEAMMSRHHFVLMIVDSSTVGPRLDFYSPLEVLNRQAHHCKILKHCTKMAKDFGVAVIVTDRVLATTHTTSSSSLLRTEGETKERVATISSNPHREDERDVAVARYSAQPSGEVIIHISYSGVEDI